MKNIKKNKIAEVKIDEGLPTLYVDGQPFQAFAESVYVPAWMKQMVPELINNPMIEYAKKMTLAEGIFTSPEIRPVYEAVINALNKQDC